MRRRLMKQMLTNPTEVFEVPTKDFLRNECTVRVPYFWKRHFFRQNIPKPPNTIEKARVLQDDKTAGA